MKRDRSDGTQPAKENEEVRPVRFRAHLLRSRFALDLRSLLSDQRRAD
jgi:hypothetical protein